MESDITNAWRIGTKVPDDKDIPALKGKGAKTTKRKPRTISVILASEAARDKIMTSRNKLKKYDDGSYLWVNEDQPEAYRRRKSMLHDLVKLAKKKAIKTRKLNLEVSRSMGEFVQRTVLMNFPKRSNRSKSAFEKQRTEGWPFAANGPTYLTCTIHPFNTMAEITTRWNNAIKLRGLCFIIKMQKLRGLYAQRTFIGAKSWVKRSVRTLIGLEYVKK